MKTTTTHTITELGDYGARVHRGTFEVFCAAGTRRAGGEWAIVSRDGETNTEPTASVTDGPKGPIPGPVLASIRAALVDLPRSEHEERERMRPLVIEAMWKRRAAA